MMLLVIRFPTTFPWVLWDGHLPQSRSCGPPTRSSVPRHVPPRSSGTVSGPPPGAGVGPSPGSVEAEKKVEASEMLQALSLLQRIMTPEDFVKYQVLVAPKTKPWKTREQELADRVKSLQRLRTQETTHGGEIDKLELDLQRHRDMLQGVLSRIRVESEECDELRAQAKEQASPGTCETILPTQSDSQPDEMYLSTVEEESGDESMLMGGSTGAEDDLDVGRDNGIWERRRNAIIKNKRMVKLKDKDILRSKPCKTVIIEEEPPPAPPASGKQLAEVIARLSQDEIGVVLSHLLSSTVQIWVQSIGSQQSLEVSSGSLLQSVGSVCSREVLKTLKSEVARSFSVVNSSCIAEPLRCDPNRGQRRVLQGAVPPRCDPTCGQRGEQCSSFSTCSSSGGGVATHHSPKCGSLGTSGSLRKSFSWRASSVPGAACGSLASSGSRGTFSLRVL